MGGNNSYVTHCFLKNSEDITPIWHLVLCREKSEASMLSALGNVFVVYVWVFTRYTMVQPQKLSDFQQRTPVSFSSYMLVVRYEGSSPGYRLGAGLLPEGATPIWSMILSWKKVQEHKVGRKSWSTFLIHGI